MLPAVRKVLKVLRERRLDFEIDLIPCRFSRLSPPKLINWLLTESSVHFKPTRPWGFPTILQVEVSSRCNLSCAMCPVTIGLDRPRGHMDLGLFQKVVDEIGEYLFVILFWDWGEPFLNPHAYQMIRQARTRGVKVIASTNGHLFATPQHAMEVVHSGLDALIFSIDGIGQETYERYRAGGRLEQAVDGIRRVVAEKRRARATNPLVNLRFIVMKHNEHELQHLGRFASSLGVDLVTVRKFHMIHSGNPEHAEILKLTPDDPKYQLPPLDRAGGKPVRATANPCRNLWNCPTIHWDGTVCSCFMDSGETRPLGNLQNRSFSEIWRGSSYRKLRKSFRSCWQRLSLCEYCSNGFEGGDVGQGSNVEVIKLS